MVSKDGRAGPPQTTGIAAPVLGLAAEAFGIGPAFTGVILALALLSLVIVLVHRRLL